MIFRISTILISLVVLTGTSLSQELELKLASPYDPRSDIGMSVETFASRLNSRLKGSAKIEVVPYKNEPGASKIQQGISMYVLPSGLLYNENNDLKLYDLPFIFKNYDDLDTLQTYIGKKILADLSKNDLIAVEYFNGGMKGLFGEYVESPTAIKGWKIATTDQPQNQLTALSVGAVSVPASFDGLALALQTGNIDAVAISYTDVIKRDVRFDSAYVYDRPYSSSVAIFLVTTEAWESLPFSILSALQEEARTLREEISERLKNEQDSIERGLSELGYKIVPANTNLSSELVEGWYNAWQAKDTKVLDLGIKFIGNHDTRNIEPERRGDVEPGHSQNYTKILFATDRRDENSRDARYRFGRSRGKELTFGEAEIALIGGRAFGEYNEKKVKLHSISLLSEDAFFKEIENANSEELSIYVHGFNTNFSTASELFSVIHSDLALRGVPILFSWPSDGLVALYSSDSEEVELSRDNFTATIKRIISSSRDRKINMMAHSMGSRLLLSSFEYQKLIGNPFHVGNIVLAAPDVSITRFEAVTDVLIAAADRLTLYASEYDRALACSRLLNDNPRAGEGGSVLTVFAGIDTIDASDVEKPTGVFDTFWSYLGICREGHSYVANNRTVVTDISTMLKFGASPDDRLGLEKLQKSNLPYWRLRPSP